jgi:hypothetical protein
LSKFWLLAGVLLVVCPTSLWARPEVHVLIATTGEWPAEVEPAVRAASNRLRQFDLVLVPTPEKLTEGESADALLAKAEAAFADSDMESARALYDKALLALEQSASMSRPMPELFFSRARFFYVQNELNAAKRELTTAARLSPTLTPDPIQYSPKIIKLHKEVLQDLKKKSLVKVSIEAPEGATVWVDGASYQGAGLSLGGHYLRVEQEGFLPFVQVLSITAEQSVQVSLSEDVYSKDQALRKQAAQDPAGMMSWAKERGAPEVLVLSLVGSQWRLTRVNESGIIAESKTSTGKLEDTIVSLIEPAGPLTISDPLPPTEDPLWKRPVFWVPMGVGMLGGAVLLSIDLLNENVGARPSIDLRGRP